MIDQSGIEIIGKGNIGEKARQLTEKTPALIQLGFCTPRRVVLAEDYFDGFFQRNGFGRNLRDVQQVQDLEVKIRSGSLTSEEFQILRKVNNCYGGGLIPLAVRSSAEGDSRGTGTYKSEFCEGHPAQLGIAVKRVLASYFSQDAIAFRRDAKTGEGFGIMIEPIIGQQIGEYIAPIISGFGYTSTSRGDGYVNVVPFLGGGVDTRDGERITENAVTKHGGTLGDYIYGAIQEMAYSVMRRTALLRTKSGDHEYYSGKAFRRREKDYPNGLMNVSLKLEETLQHQLGELDFISFFQKMKKMERVFGKPQYFEWAVTIEYGEPKFWITQIADVNKRLDVMDFDDSGRVLFEGHTVTGTGIKTCDKIAECWNPGDESGLYGFNQENRNYVLLYSSRLTSRAGAHSLHYSQFSNASVFLEIQDANHSGDPVAHLGGQLDMAGKFFAVLDHNEENPTQFDRFKEGCRKEHDISVYQRRVKVISSERQNRMVVSELD